MEYTYVSLAASGVVALCFVALDFAHRKERSRLVDMLAARTLTEYAAYHKKMAEATGRVKPAAPKKDSYSEYLIDE